MLICITQTIKQQPMDGKNITIKHKGEFENIGYFKEIYLNGKYHGCINMDSMDREHIGWAGRRTEKATEEIKIKNKKIIRIGTEITTMCFPLQGRVKKS